MFETAWETLRERWEDVEAHRRFLDFCASVDQLGDAAKRYRAVLDATPGDGPAAAGLAEIQRRAVARLTVASDERNRQWIRGAGRTWMGLLVVMAVAVLVGWAIYLFGYRR